MIKKLARFFWGLILIPLLLSTYGHLPAYFTNLSANRSSLIYLAAGFVGYILFEIAFSKPMRTYVFGHELTHALTAMAFGGRVQKFKVSKNGGSVSVSESNFLVALSPYCVPIYTLFVLLLSFVLRFWVPFERFHHPFLVLVGATLAFHASLTLFAIRQEQPDIEKSGVFFSLVFIILVNGWILACLTKLLFWDLVAFKSYAAAVLKTQLSIWEWCFVKSQLYGSWLYQKISSRI